MFTTRPRSGSPSLAGSTSGESSRRLTRSECDPVESMWSHPKHAEGANSVPDDGEEFDAVVHTSLDDQAHVLPTQTFLLQDRSTQAINEDRWRRDGPSQTLPRSDPVRRPRTYFWPYSGELR